MVNFPWRLFGHKLFIILYAITALSYLRATKERDYYSDPAKYLWCPRICLLYCFVIFNYLLPLVSLNWKIRWPHFLCHYSLIVYVFVFVNNDQWSWCSIVCKDTVMADGPKPEKGLLNWTSLAFHETQATGNKFVHLHTTFKSSIDTFCYFVWP